MVSWEEIGFPDGCKAKWGEIENGYKVLGNIGDLRWGLGELLRRGFDGWVELADVRGEGGIEWGDYGIRCGFYFVVGWSCGEAVGWGV